MAATPDGQTLLYTNAADMQIGFVDLADPAKPRLISTLSLPGQPTSIAVTPNGKWALATVFDPNQVSVVDLSNRTVAATLPLGGQPDSIAISSDGRYAAIAIENERDEDRDRGRMPQDPPGFLTILDLVGEPSAWRKREIALTGLAGRFPEDPEPEYVSINDRNIAAVTLQENNHVVLVNLADGAIAAHWSAGVVTQAADTKNDGNIAFDSQIVNARREPDAIAWTPGRRLLTANEGDYDVDLGQGEFSGGRGFTLFAADGKVVFDPGASLEMQAASIGHYPDNRSHRRGIEVEGVEVALFDGVPLAFLASERGNFLAVYLLTDEANPQLHQVLPTGVGPEGINAIPSRNLVVTANEVDGTISIYARDPVARAPAYPDIRADEGWGALSGLAAASETRLFAVPDSFFKPSRIYQLDREGDRAVISRSLRLAAKYDPEGIALRPGGGWWLASEGAGNAPNNVVSKNLLIAIREDGSLEREIALPAELNAQQRQFGFEGVATTADGSHVYVAFQREWADDPPGLVKMGRYTPATDEWAFFHYPIDPAPTDGWVGLSDLARVDDDTYLVLERDNQRGDQAQVKRIYRISFAGITPAPAGGTPPVNLPRVTKTLVRDLLTMDDWRLEKAEGLAVLPSGRLVVVNDNDGVGETRLLTLSAP